MSKISSKIAFPITLAGLFAITIFLALDPERVEFQLYAILFVLAVCIFFFGISIGRSFASPINQLLESAKQLSNGNLSSRSYIETKDEISELAKVFNQIAEELEQSQINQENAEKSVDIKVKAKTQELEETIAALEQKVKNRTIELERQMQAVKELQAQLKEAK